MRSAVYRIVTALAILTLAQSAAADELYSQSSSGFGLFLSSSDSVLSKIDGGGVTADNFTLAETSGVGAVVWWGKGLTNVSGFTVVFYASNAGSVGAVVSSQSVPSPTPIGTGPVFQYEATLAAPVVLDGGVEFFVSIVANLIDTSATPTWGWEATTIGPDDDVHFSIGGGGFAPAGLGGSGFGNAAFELLSTPSGFLEDLAREICLDIFYLDLSEFRGSDRYVKRARRFTLAILVCIAANYIAYDYPDVAAFLATLVLLRMDGLDNPHDWVHGSPATEAIADDLRLLIELLLIS